MQPNRKILEAIENRVTARVTAKDASGLRALIEAAERGRKLAEDALKTLEGTPVDLDGERDARRPETAIGAARDDKRPETAPETTTDKTPEEIRYERMLEQQLEREYASSVYQEIMSQGGIRVSSENVREEYRVIPPSYRRRDGMPGDELAEHLSVHRPELGIRDERDLLEFFSERRTRRNNAAAA